MAQTNKPAYQYAPLPDPSMHVRLATIWRDTDRTHPIQCSLGQYPLSECPSYFALSYVCGDPNDAREVIIDGASLYVYSNLDNALRHLRRPNAEVKLWADALCINQSNNEEKSAQIGTLSTIFRNARPVVSWLGPANRSKLLALKVLQRLGQGRTLARMNELRRLKAEFKHHQVPGPNLLQHIQARWLVARVTESVDRSALSRICSNLLRDPFNTGSHRKPWLYWHNQTQMQHILGKSNSEHVEALLDDEYFTRIWIFQEVALAGKLVFACGDLRYDGEAVFVAMAIIFSHQALESHPAAILWREAMTVLTLLHYAIHNRPAVGTAPKDSVIESLLSLMDSLSAGVCTDPRDRIFALLPLSADPLAKLNPVDYTLSAVEIAKRLTRTYIEEKGTLEILGFCGLSSPCSWAIDLEAASDTYLGGMVRKGSTDVRKYSAATKLLATVIIDSSGPDTNVLKLRGIRMDSISQIGPLCEDLLKNKTSPPLQEWWNLARTVKATEFDFWMAITAESRSTVGAEVMWKTREQDIEEWLKSKGTDLPMASISHFWQNVGLVFFITDSGRMGLCNPDARHGDQVCLLYGGPTPYLLRPVATAAAAAEPQYGLVGSCYVHGIMEGELMEDVEHGKFEEEVFALV